MSAKRNVLREQVESGAAALAEARVQIEESSLSWLSERSIRLMIKH